MTRRYMAGLIEAALTAKEGISPSPLDADIVNDAAGPLFNAVAPGEMKRRLVDAAVAVDAAIDALNPELLSRTETEGKPFLLNRWGTGSITLSRSRRHWHEHGPNNRSPRS
jgi:hypothetical protein